MAAFENNRLAQQGPSKYQPMYDLQENRHTVIGLILIVGTGTDSHVHQQVLHEQLSCRNRDDGLLTQCIRRNGTLHQKKYNFSRSSKAKNEHLSQPTVINANIED